LWVSTGWLIVVNIFELQRPPRSGVMPTCIATR
jgi:hypothetical protein